MCPLGPKHGTQLVALHIRIHASVAYLARTATAIKVSYVLEQPASSLLYKADFRTMFDVSSVWRTLHETKAEESHVSLLYFGGASKKPLILKGTAPWLPKLQEVSRLLQGQTSHTASASLVSVDSNGNYTGKRKELKASSAYPPNFGKCIAWCVLGHDALSIVNRLQHKKRRKTC